MGMILLILGGMISGLFTTLLPLSRWQWETKWLCYTALAYAAMPWFWASQTVYNLPQAYADAKISSVVACAVFGLLWGIGSQLFGLGVAAVGNSLGDAYLNL